jgi:hypothetical protein
MMITELISSYRTTIQALTLGLGMAIILAGCNGNPSPAGKTVQPAPQTQAPTQKLQPTNTSLPNETQAPTETQGAAPTATKSTGSGINACALVTKEEAEAAVGSPVGDPVEDDYPPQYGCKYSTSSLDQVSIDLIVYDDAQQANDAFQMEIDINSYEEVSGIGDRALRPSPIMDITVIKGKYEMSVDVLNDSDDEVQYEKAKELAIIALGRLP